MADVTNRVAVAVYPRTGGGNVAAFPLSALPLGLSPHGRGKPIRLLLLVCVCGSIPARAGETSKAAAFHIGGRVYPRTGGGNLNTIPPNRPLTGLSPHGRGKPAGWAPLRPREWSIPARAGETTRQDAIPPKGEVYPRTGGGNSAGGLLCAQSWGLSPHGRGKHPVDGDESSRQRSIPARAGETYQRGLYRPPAGVYPRTGGGNNSGGLYYLVEGGLSPHGRGKPASPPGQSPAPRSIPARAGETAKDGWRKQRQTVYPRTGGGNRLSRFAINPPLRSIPARAGETYPYEHLPAKGTVYPRTGGGNPIIADILPIERGLSPHGRGKRVSGRRPQQQGGSIPARAGETFVPRVHGRQARVYPRTGGGNLPLSGGQMPEPGLSPHGRGKRPGPASSWGLWGSIPARAGETILPPSVSNCLEVYPRTGGGNRLCLS